MKAHPAYEALVDAFTAARAAPLPSPRTPQPVRPPEIDKPTAVLISPHPDDEVIMGALPRRWQRELGCNVHVIAVTLGSNPSRRSAREAELTHACGLLGWHLHLLGWTGVDADAIQPNADRVRQLREILRPLQPDALFFPHDNDQHPAHLGVHRLAREALAEIPNTPAIYLTEFWHPMENPNLLVEVPPTDLACLIEALACHTGEVARNPYHRTLPAWMMENVRRGAERVGKVGGSAPDFPFGILYRTEPPPDNPILRVTRPG